MKRTQQTEARAEVITFPPTNTVRIGEPELRRLYDEGLAFRREIEKRSAPMFAVTSSEASTKMR